MNRINPVNSTMINAMKRNVNRDPRLQKQTNNNTGNKQEPGQKSDTNVPSKVNVRIDPRLNNANKDAPKADAGKPKSPLKSSKSDKPRSATKNGSDTSKSSQDDEKKDKNDKSRSPSKKDKDKKKDKYEDKKSSSSRPKKSSASETQLSAAAFKEVKSRSNRNYLRRNRSPSESPERVHDVDLRSFGPPEKQMRLQGDTTDEKSKIFVVFNFITVIPLIGHSVKICYVCLINKLFSLVFLYCIFFQDLKIHPTLICRFIYYL